VIAWAHTLREGAKNVPAIGVRMNEDVVADCKGIKTQLIRPVMKGRIEFGPRKVPGITFGKNHGVTDSTRQ
jgi:hypothetical protein